MGRCAVGRTEAERVQAALTQREVQVVLEEEGQAWGPKGTWPHPTGSVSAAIPRCEAMLVMNSISTADAIQRMNNESSGKEMRDMQAGRQQGYCE